MPRPCAVESHARHYKKHTHSLSSRCHGLAPWSLTLAATKTTHRKNLSALRRGVSRSPLQKQPQPKSLRCHGLAPWSLTLAPKKHTPSRCHGPICSCGKMKLEWTRYLTNVPTIVSTSRAPFRILLSRLSAISHPSIPTVFTVSFTQTLRTRQSDAPLRHTCP